MGGGPTRGIRISRRDGGAVTNDTLDLEFCKNRLTHVVKCVDFVFIAVLRCVLEPRLFLRIDFPIKLFRQNFVYFMGA
jgi:hypothetical protein